MELFQNIYQMPDPCGRALPDPRHSGSFSALTTLFIYLWNAGLRSSSCMTWVFILGANLFFPILISKIKYRFWCYTMYLLTLPSYCAAFCFIQRFHLEIDQSKTGYAEKRLSARKH